MGECVFVVKTYHRLYAIKTGISSEGEWGIRASEVCLKPDEGNSLE
jgi:hypothetical protein